MTSPHKCSRCGADLTAFGHLGLCARCLLQEGLAAPTEAGVEAEDLVALPEAEPGSRVRLFGDYELLEELGHGGMGVVYKARQKSLNRLVALKMVAGGEFAGREYVGRLRAEAEAAAQLRHPNIVAIHEVGEQEGQHYFSMDYVEGTSLADLTRHRPLAPRQAACYVRTIAEAVHFAHQHGILHRDLKPSNILVDLHDQIRIMDFGLAKRLGTDSEFTVTGELIGSPNYLSPEQAAGQHRELTPASDVYALGAVLYHLLTGRAPFQAQAMAAILRQVQEKEPVALRLLNPSIPRDLETICLKCLEKDTQRRYASAQGLADDLGRFLEGRPILARPVSRPERLWRWCRRQPVQASLAAGLITVVILGFGGVILQWREAEAARGKADEERQNAQRMAYAADMSLAFRALERDDLGEAYHCLTNHWPEAGEPDLRGWEWRYLWGQCQGQELVILGRHPREAGAVAFSPDGRLLASGGRDGQVKIWSLSSTQQVHSLGTPGNILALAFAPDSNQLAVGGQPGILLWNTRTWREEDVTIIARRVRAESLCFALEGTRLVAASFGDLGVWQVGENVKELDPLQDRYNSPGQHACALSSNGKVVAYQKSRLWGGASVLRRNLETGEQSTPILKSGFYNARTMAISPDSQWLALAPNQGPVEVYRFQDAKELLQEPAESFTLDSTRVFALAFSPDGKLLAAGGYNGRIELWETTTWSRRQKLVGHRSTINDIAFGPDPKHPLLATASADGTVRLWSILPRKQEDLLSFDVLPHGWDPPWDIALSLHREKGFYTLWRFATPSIQTTNPLPYTNIVAANIGPGGKLVAFSLKGPSVRLWDATGEGAERWGMPTQALAHKLAFSPSGRLLFGFSHDGRMWVWEVASGREIGSAENSWDQCGLFYLPQFSGDERQLVIPYGRDGGVCLWDFAGSGEILRFEGRHPGCINAALSPDGTTVASVNSSGSIKLWDVPSQREVAEIEGRGLSLCAVVFSPDGNRVIAGGLDETRVWDVRTRREVATLMGGTDTPGGFILNFRDQDTLLAGTAKGIRRLRAPTLTEIDAAEGRRKVEEGRSKTRTAAK